MPHFKSNRPTLSEGCQCVQSLCCRRRLQGRSCRSSCRSPPRSLRSGSTAPRRGRCQRRLLRGGPVQGAEDEKTSWILELRKKVPKNILKIKLTSQTRLPAVSEKYVLNCLIACFEFSARMPGGNMFHSGFSTKSYDRPTWTGEVGAKSLLRTETLTRRL